MAGSVNKVILVGNVGGDPEIRSVGDGRVATISLATSQSWKDKRSGERKERTEWHRVKVWGKPVDFIEKFVVKGDKLYVEGELRTDKWTDKNGQERYTTEVVCQGYNSQVTMMSSKSKSGGGGGSAYSGSTEDPGYGPQGGSFGADPFDGDKGKGVDDEIPF